jgi:hypothetical protein
MLDRAASIAAISSVRVLVSRNGGSSGWIEVMLSPADTGSPTEYSTRSRCPAIGEETA